MAARTASFKQWARLSLDRHPWWVMSGVMTVFGFVVPAVSYNTHAIVLLSFSLFILHMFSINSIKLTNKICTSTFLQNSVFPPLESR